MKFRIYMDVDIAERGIKRAFRLRQISEALKDATEDVIRKMRATTDGIRIKKLEEDEECTS